MTHWRHYNQLPAAGAPCLSSVFTNTGAFNQTPLLMAPHPSGCQQVCRLCDEPGQANPGVLLTSPVVLHHRQSQPSRSGLSRSPHSPLIASDQWAHSPSLEDISGAEQQTALMSCEPPLVHSINRSSPDGYSQALIDNNKYSKLRSALFVLL